ncbi:MAG TPA: Rieske 2Fe-2S domain-containing protein [Actinomycetales bacterium]|nr:Rieske 2Fe-2S domain-containing protein [Actinomycetales bacterium]
MDATHRLPLPALLERVTSRLEKAQGLDTLAGRLQKLVTSLPPGRVKDALSGTPSGHPVHPALVALPIGTFAGVAVLDAVDADAATTRRLLGFGILSVVPTAAAGLSDWGDTGGGERRVGVVHALCNVAATFLMAASWWRRRHGGGRWLSTTALGLLAFSGWLGGHLAYARGTGVDVTAFEDEVTEWTDAMADADLQAHAPAVARVGRNDVLLVRHGDTISALADRCTHRGGPLHEGELVDGCIQCPWHGSRFVLTDGATARGPASRPQPAYETRVVGGRVQVRSRTAS